jgi:hypothetical protein
VPAAPVFAGKAGSYVDRVAFDTGDKKRRQEKTH